MTDILETARWVAEGRLAPWAVSDESVVEMARKLLQAVEACEAMQEAANDAAKRAALDSLRSLACEAAVEAEREACARVCDDDAVIHASGWYDHTASLRCAAAIRARGGR